MREYEAWLANWITADEDEVAEQLAKPLPKTVAYCPTCHFPAVSVMGRGVEFALALHIEMVHDV